MQFDNKLFADFSKLASSAVNAAGDISREASDNMRAQFEKVLTKMNFVTRDEFDAVREMALKARQENEALGKRIDAFEGKAAPTKPAKNAAKPK